MPRVINGVEVTTELEVKLMSALSDLYKMTYYYFKRTPNASPETQSKRVIAICNLLEYIHSEFNPEDSGSTLKPTTPPTNESTPEEGESTADTESDPVPEGDPTTPDHDRDGIYVEPNDHLPSADSEGTEEEATHEGTE